MERLFVRILNGTLLVGGFLTLLAAVAAAAVAVFSLLPVILADTADKPIKIEYRPISVFSGTVTENAGTANPADGQSALRSSAQRNCKAMSAFAELITDQQVGITDTGKCADSNVAFATQNWAGRAQNYLDERATYFDAMRADPQVRTKYPTGDASKINQYFDEIIRGFDERFAKAAAADDNRKSQAAVNSLSAKTFGAIWAGIAASIFFSFLVIAFLIVAIRIEKHLGKIEEKI